MASSRDLASNLRKLAYWLDTKPEFPVSDATANGGYQPYYDHKAEFLAAVRALGSGKKGKGVLDYYLRFTADTPEGTEFAVEVNRESVCRLIRPAQEAVYDCEPLLSTEEEAQLGV